MLLDILTLLPIVDSSVLELLLAILVEHCIPPLPAAVNILEREGSWLCCASLRPCLFVALSRPWLVCGMIVGGQVYYHTGCSIPHCRSKILWCHKTILAVF